MQPTVKISNLPKVVSPALTAKVPLVNGTETDYALLSDLITLFFNNVPTGVIPGLTTNYVISGGVWTGDSYAVNRNASMTAITVYLGQRSITIGAVTARTFTASKDTYIDVLNNLDGTGTLVYTEVANNAASPALAANSVRIGIIITGATTIAAATSINQGQQDRLLPLAGGDFYQVTDSLGNLICCRDPNGILVGYRSVFTAPATSSASTTIVDMAGMDIMPVIVPAGRRVKITTLGNANSTVAADILEYYIREGATTLGQWRINAPGTGGHDLPTPGERSVEPTTGLHTYKFSFSRAAGTGTCSFDSLGSMPLFIKAELV